jgi:hypothetical protein
MPSVGGHAVVGVVEQLIAWKPSQIRPKAKRQLQRFEFQPFESPIRVDGWIFCQTIGTGCNDENCDIKIINSHLIIRAINLLQSRRTGMAK